MFRLAVTRLNHRLSVSHQASFFRLVLCLFKPLYIFLGFEEITDERSWIIVTNASTDTLITVNCTESETFALSFNITATSRNQL